MKFCKRYEAYMQGRREKELPAVGLKKLKKTLKRCRREFQPQHQLEGEGGSKCPGNCAVCDGTFFPSLLKEMSAVVGCFNQRAQKLLELHLASGFHKYIMWFKGKTSKNHGELIQEGKDLVSYAIINSIAMRKILKKYDKIHYSKQGQAFKSKALSMHIEILQSPWLSELMAFYINMREGQSKKKAMVELFGDCSLTFDDDGKPTLSCGLFDSMKIEIDLTCSICLETVFDPVALTCGHLFCCMCACSAASVTIVDGLKTASPKAKCPLCRQEGVYAAAIHLDELNILLRESCPDYWKERLQIERAERIRQAKEHWQSLSRQFIGI
ncbi:putative E3 ubiquitin-protein ligase BAH1-like 1 [Canna indica]|uniref:RING-type E3 ubiquitin transferase n=1 Tax=Canna indica TaxID=4628 RepID=A0AAQ3Q7G3_9LILI|nr:putative E3 ubiquitin-protein ligase BAH1-like 1 [Canna indica]